MRLSIPAVLLAVAAPGAAHVVVAPATGVADTYQAIVLRVSHGCGDAATSSIAVGLPEALDSARPAPVVDVQPGGDAEGHRH